MAHIVIPYTPRPAFNNYHANTKRLAITVAHRRAGKTVARINKLVKESCLCTLPSPRFAYIAPYYVQAKDIAWQYLLHYTSPMVAHGLKKNEAELSVTLPHNGAIIKLYGAENAERMRGLYQDGIVIDEGQGIAKKILTQIILPSLADRKGWLDVSGTPKGWENMLGQLVKMARANPADWYLEILKASETGIIDAEELVRLQQLMPENEYLQEFECDFDAAITGAVYGKWLREAELGGRFRSDLHDPQVKVSTSWDLGYSDATAIWFWQQVRGEIRLIDYYENTGHDIPHYCNVIKNKPYSYADHFVPHDAANKLLQAGGRSTVDIAHDLGINMRIVAATTQGNQIEAARSILSRCWFDPSACEYGIACLKQYQYEYDADKGRFRDKPRHDWSSHGADAFEIIGQVLRDQREDDKPKAPRFLHEATADEVFWPKDNHTHKRERI